ncbi:hypothetical protein BGZ72_010154 [Mortierella alpina]|nr:hypothetical protein BGZ72_010154 [Mortierella alpina]
MRCLVRLTLAITLLTAFVSAAAAADVAAADVAAVTAASTPETSSSLSEAFLQDPTMKELAPSLLQHVEKILRQPNAPPVPSTDSTSLISIPILRDLIKVVCLTFARPDPTTGFDLSKIEAAKRQAIQAHGEEAVYAAANCSAYDAETYTAIVDLIYDAVVFLKPIERHDLDGQLSMGLKMVGRGLETGSGVIKALQSFVIPHLGGCETSDGPYLEGAETIAYVGSMAYGLAGAVIVSAPEASAVKAANLGDLIISVIQMTIGLMMAQNVARMAGLDPQEPCVKTISYMLLAGDVDSARDLDRLKRRALEGEIPKDLLPRIDQQAAVVLVTKGVGQSTGPPLFANVFGINHFFAFVDQWSCGNRIGNDIKFVFCPDAQKGEVGEGGDGGDDAADADERNKKEEEQEKAEKEQAKKDLAHDQGHVENKLEL